LIAYLNWFKKERAILYNDSYFPEKFSMCRSPLSLALLFAFLFSTVPGFAQEKGSMKTRARDLGVPFDGTPGPLNAITDVPGVTVGHTTLISGEGSSWSARGQFAPASPRFCRAGKIP
jgi:hypothetical protein